MPISDPDVHRSANLRLEFHGGQAVAKARSMADAMQTKGDAAGADAWLRTIVAIRDLPKGRRQPIVGTAGAQTSAPKRQQTVSRFSDSIGSRYGKVIQ